MRRFAPQHRKPVRFQRTLRVAVGVAVVIGLGFALPEADATTTYTTAQPGTFQGSAFDACSAPSTDTMATWYASSPYRAIGIYIGGVARGCGQPNLTADWVHTVVTAGWHLIPIYVGPQASCTTAGTTKLIDDTQAYAQGGDAAKDAVAQAKLLGLGANSAITYDMESYGTDATCKAGVFSFMNAWSATLHHYNYYSGYYSSMGSGGADQVAHYSATAYVRPDYIDYARWDGVATTTDVAVPSADWPGRRRMKQYSGGHTETYGGVTINIDDDYVDFAPLPSATMADYNRDGWSDLAARTKSNGDLYDYPGNGAYASDGYKFKIAGGLSSMNAVVRIGDLNRDGYPDFVMRTTSGSLYFYPGKSNGTLGTRRLLSTGFAKMREITAIGDLTKDGYPDLIAAQTSNHALYLYPGAAGDKLGPRKLIGSSGWQTMSELAGVGDFTKDGYPDLITKQTTTGNLYLYPGKKGTIGTGKVLATGFSGMRDLVGVGDFDRDGHTDLAAVLSSSGYLELYRGTGGALLPGVRLATGYGGRTSLA